MTTTGLSTFDHAVQTANVWLDDVMRRLGWTDREVAYRAVKVVLHALRDRLGVDEAAHLAAQLPLLLRGTFYEGWHPAGTPNREHREDFLSHIGPAFGGTRGYDPDADPERITRAVLGTLAKHVTEGEVEKVCHCLPRDLQTLWP